MEQEKIKFKTIFDRTEPDEFVSDSGDPYAYEVEWEKPLATLDKDTGEIIQAHGDPIPHLIKKYNRDELIQAALPSTDMQTIIAKSKVDPTQFQLNEFMVGDTTDLPIDDYNALANYHSDIVMNSLRAAEESYDKLTDDEKALVGSKEELYRAVLAGNVDSIVKNYIDSKKEIKKEEVDK